MGHALYIQIPLYGEGFGPVFGGPRSGTLPITEHGHSLHVLHISLPNTSL